MLRIYCDFNDETEDHMCWILSYDGKPVDEQINQLGLKEGDRVLLYQDEDDFEVEGTLRFDQRHSYFVGEKLCARVEWTTFRRL